MNLVDVNGKRITRQKHERLVIMESRDDGESWDPVPGKNVPGWVKCPDVMGALVKGEFWQAENSDTWYRAERVH